jgi:hypothetical protein
VSIDPLAYLPPPITELAAADTTADTATRRENTARPATAVTRHVVNGIGQTVHPDVLLFYAAFDGQPTFTYGVELTNHDPKYAYPNATAGVYRWSKDTKGFYNGAYLYFDVSAIPSNIAQLQLGEQTARLNLAFAQMQYEQMKNTPNPYYRSGDGGAQDLLAERWQLDHYMKEYLQQAKVKAAQAAYEVALAALNKAMPTEPAKTITTFHLSFYGTAIKALPDAITDASVSGDLPTRSVAWGAKS